MSTPVSRLSGVMSPVLTPFNGDLTPSPSRFVKHCRWFLKQEVGLAIFGTNSEANSLTVKEKVSLLDTLLAAGLPAAKNRGSSDKEQIDLRNRMNALFKPNRLMENAVNPYYPEHYLGAGCADWAVKTVRTFADDFFNRLEIQPNYQQADFGPT